MAMYKCYVSTTNNEKYYWYFKDASAKVYGNENGLMFPVKEVSALDLVVNVVLCSITDKVVHLMFDKQVPIFGVRSSKHDIEVTDGN